MWEDGRTGPHGYEELPGDRMVAQRRVEQPRVELMSGESRADNGAAVTDHWRRSGTNELGAEFVEGQPTERKKIMLR